MKGRTMTIPAVDRSGAYHPALDALRHIHASGVYAILDDNSGECLYVGESHTGRLFDTITRHFRRWRINPHTDATGRRRGGTTYDRTRVSVSYSVTRDDQAQAAQAEWIAELDPRDNTQGPSSEPEDLDVPV